jgi:GDP-4-dehydro-6-deoxy-D-mannose reductase
MDSRLLYVSSSEVYGPVHSDHLPLREETTFRPANPYAGSKAAAELLALQFFQSYGLPIIRARPFNHTGPRQSATFVCSSLARQLAEIDAGLRPPIITVGNLQVCRDFSDVRDIVRGYHLLLEKGEPGDVYQLCSGRAVSIGAVLSILKDSTSTPVQVTVDQPRGGSREAPALWGEFTKAERAVGWIPQYHLETTLGDLKLYWKRQLQS